MIVYDCQQNVFFLKKIYEQQNVFQTDTCLQFKEVTKTFKIKFVLRHRKFESKYGFLLVLD